MYDAGSSMKIKILTSRNYFVTLAAQHCGPKVSLNDIRVEMAKYSKRYNCKFHDVVNPGVSYYMDINEEDYLCVVLQCPESLVETYLD